jgi:hypothetical protein
MQLDAAKARYSVRAEHLRSPLLVYMLQLQMTVPYGS